jgi:hypothetical protein
MQCFWAGGLTSLGGNATALCPDGTITQYTAQNGLSRNSSWYHPGSAVAVLSPHEIAIVDQSSGQILLNDISTNTVSQVTAHVPEVDAAISTVAAKTKALSKADAASLGKVLIALDTATDETGWYILIGPYNNNTGPAVAKFDRAGQLIARFRLHVPQSTLPIQQLEAQGGLLAVVSVSGEFLIYKK